MRTTLAALALLGGLLSGCGEETATRAGETPAPTAVEPTTPDATRAADGPTFCDTYAAHFQSMTEIGEADVPARIRLVQEWLDDADEVGLPSDMPDEARAGYAVLSRTVRSVDAETATPDELSALIEEAGTVANRKLDAFGEYLDRGCPEVRALVDEQLDEALDDAEDTERPSN